MLAGVNKFLKDLKCERQLTGCSEDGACVCLCVCVCVCVCVLGAASALTSCPGHVTHTLWRTFSPHKFAHTHSHTLSLSLTHTLGSWLMRSTSVSVCNPNCHLCCLSE